MNKPQLLKKLNNKFGTPKQIKIMKNYTEGITEEIMNSNGIGKLQTMVESGSKPRMIVKYKDGEEMTIDGDEEITKFVDELKQK